MNQLRKILIIVLSIFVLNTYDIKGQSTEIIEKKLTLDIEVSELSDGSFLSRATTLIFKNNKLYMSESNRAQIIIFDKDLNFKNTVARHGKGPNEFIYLGDFSINGDTIIAKDTGGQRIQIFKDNGKHLKSVNLQDIISKINLYRNLRYSNNILTIASTTESALAKYDFSSGKPILIKEFGERYEFGNTNQNKVRNNRYIDIIDGKLLTISNTVPIIELYDKDEKLLSKYDFGDIPIIKEQMEFIDKQKIELNSHWVLTTSYCVDNKDLYIVINTFVPSHLNNKIIKFSLDDNKFTPKAIYTLPGSYFDGIAVNNNYLYSFDYDKSSICRFKL